MKKLALFVLLARDRRRRGRRVDLPARRRAVSRLRRRGAVRRNPGRRRQPRDRRPPGGSRRRSRCACRFASGLYLSGQGRRLQAGEYRFDRAMTPMRGDRQAGARRRVRRQHHVPRRADHRRDGKDLRDARARPGRRVRRQPRAIPSPIKALDPDGAGSRRLSVSGNVPAAAPHRRVAARQADDGPLRAAC